MKLAVHYFKTHHFNGKKGPVEKASLNIYCALWISCMILLLLPATGYSQTRTFQGTADYNKYGLKPHTVENWEDGLRTNTGKREFEWWYFDTHIDTGRHKGTVIVVGFYTKSFVGLKRKAKPFVTVNINPPSGEPYECAIEIKRNESFFVSKDSCYVQIGKNSFQGNLKNYKIHVEDPKNFLELDIEFERLVPSWRPLTGYSNFFDRKGRENYFAWLVAVPKGKAKIQVAFQNKNKKIVSFESTGSCYHDHNWGDKGIEKLFNHWYWCRTSFGDTAVIAASMIAAKEYNFQEQVVFNVSTPDKTETKDDATKLAYQSYARMEGKLKKDVSDHLKYIYEGPSGSSNSNDSLIRYEYSLDIKKYLSRVNLLAAAINRDSQNERKGLLYFAVNLLTGYEGAYYRFGGTSNLRVMKDGCLKQESRSKDSVWELMYLGRPLK